MKKYLALLVATIMLFSLIACGEKQNADSSGTSTSNTATTTQSGMGDELNTDNATSTTTNAASDTHSSAQGATDRTTSSRNTATSSSTQSPSISKIDNIIPPDGFYTIIHKGEILFEGDTIPSTPSIGDWLHYGDYTYTFVSINNQYGWDVLAESFTGEGYKSSYGNILLSINNFPIIAMTSTFHSNPILTTVPSIPDTVIDMMQSFHSCTALISAPKLPDGLLSMEATFDFCTALKTYDGAVKGTADGDFSEYNIPSKVSDQDIINAFYNCHQITALPRMITNSNASSTNTTTITTTQTTTTTTTTTSKPTTTTTSAPADVLIISDTRTISDQTIDTDVYITSTGVATFKNVTVNGNIYCYGQLTTSATVAKDVYAYRYGSMMSCGAWDGTHGKVSGGLSCDSLYIKDDALDYAFNKWGKR